MKNKVLIFIAGLLIGAVITASVGYVYLQKSRPMGKFQDGERPDFEGRMERRDGEEPPERPNGKFGGPEEKTEKETKAGDVEKGTEITDSEIDLSSYNTNITITKSGNYTLVGNFKNAILIDADSDVTLTLAGVNIENKNTAAIANISKNALTIELPEGSTNTLSDGGSSEYDACVYSNGALIINGSGTLNVYGNQQEGEGIATETNNITINDGKINIECEDDGINAGGDGGTITINDGEIYIKASGDGIDSNKNLVINGGTIYTIGSATGGDAGIDTDGGYEINGGTVIALGSDMLEKPENSSKQKSVAFSLNRKVSNGTEVSLKNANGEEVLTFEAKEDFKTLLISNNKIENDTYYLYENGTKTDFSATVK